MAAPDPTFVRPELGWFALLDGGVATLVTFTASEAAYDQAKAIVPLPSRRTIRAILLATIVVHVGEALFARSLARAAGLPSARWARQTFIVGFPSLRALKQVIASR